MRDRSDASWHGLPSTVFDIHYPPNARKCKRQSVTIFVTERYCSSDSLLYRKTLINFFAKKMAEQTVNTPNYCPINRKLLWRFSSSRSHFRSELPRRTRTRRPSTALILPGRYGILSRSIHPRGERSTLCKRTYHPTAGPCAITRSRCPPASPNVPASASSAGGSSPWSFPPMWPSSRTSTPTPSSPSTPSPPASIAQAIINVSDVPVFVGVGGGTPTGPGACASPPTPSTRGLSAWWSTHPWPTRPSTRSRGS